MKRSIELEKEAVLMTAGHMAAAARTAPKTRGQDNIWIFAVKDEKTRRSLVETMKTISKREERPSFERDANSVSASHAIIAIGVRSNPAGLNCGFCGYKTCEELKKTKGVCAYNSIDLGIAVSSAAEMANRFRIDNRLMYSIGRACLDLELFGRDVKQALGIPLSATGKNPYFDRK
ncbi:MAG: DUF2148 domain-containing protein [Candidatus Omnitrophica bacterium]|nr:DUF2148 domain-containing protein [Candidatus Omnitrophota bacterium]